MSNQSYNDIPEDVYVQFVRSLFNSAHTVLIGACIHALLTFMVVLNEGEPIYAGLAVTLLLVGIWRYAGMRKFARAGEIHTEAEARRWEREYVVRGSVQAFAIGSFCFVSFYVTADHFAEIIAICITFGSLVSVAGRNYGSSRMVAIFSMAFLLPFGLGLVLRGDIPHVVLGLMVLPYILIVKSTADQIREVLFSAVVGHKNARKIAHRFDRALNTMSHGLVMLGPSGKVAVANAQAAEVLGFDSSARILGRSLKALLLRGVAGGLLSMKDARYAETQLTRALREGRDRKLLLRLTNGRHFEFSAREGHDELGVITFEEVTQRVEAEEKIRTMARYDSLTGLPNRAYFHELVAEYLAGGDRERMCGLAVFDLDDFKSVNDTLGHPVGDGLISSVADRLAVFSDEDLKISRFGGDEFMVFANRVKDRDHFTAIVDDMFSRVQGEVDVAGHALRVQVSAGAVLSKVGEVDVDSMIVKADLALYKAKELGKNGWRLFEAEMDAEFRTRQILKADLRSAIESRELRVVYQPIISTQTMRIASCEALCRWDHPELGPIPPSVFIPLAEEMGIVSEISSFVLSAACRECMKWPEHLRVTVNLSAKDFRSSEVVIKVGDALTRTGLAPERLEIEVTETALLDDKASTRHFIEDLKQLGVSIALDDFGTGYSSLSYLHTLPLDKVKIDGSFVTDVNRDPRSLELLRGVVDLSRRLGLAVTVEGVETFEQMRRLSDDIHPDFVQGFLFGSALSASGIETMSTTVWSITKKNLSAVEQAVSQ